MEVLIAIAIVALCIIPLLNPHLFMFQEEKRFIREVELDRQVGILYANLLVDGFYHETIDWETIVSGEPIPITDAAIAALGYSGNYKFAVKKKKAKIDEDRYALYLLKITYTFKPFDGGKTLSYSYLLFLQRKEKVKFESQETSEG